MHQRANAAELARAGAALIIEDAKDASTNAAAIKPFAFCYSMMTIGRTAMAEAAQIAASCMRPTILPAKFWR